MAHGGDKGQCGSGSLNRESARNAQIYVVFKAHPQLPHNHPIMSNTMQPFESEFATVEEAEAIDRWFRAQVQASLEDQRPSTSHDQAMAELRKLVDVKHSPNASDPMAR